MNQRILVVVAASLATLSCQESRTYQEPASPEESRPTPEPAVVAPPEAPPEQPAMEEPPPPQPEQAAMLSDKDKKFVETASQGGMREVALSKIAKERSTREPIKQLADRMIMDHERVNEELRLWLHERNLDQVAPTQPDATTTALEEELGKLGGKKLDKRYLDLMLEDHRKDVELFREASTSADDQSLREWAGQTLPMLESHVQHVTMVKAGKAMPKEPQPPKVGRASTPKQ